MPTENKHQAKKKRSRGRPHPNDYHFPGSFPFTQKKMCTGPKKVIFALGMSWHRLRDRTRLQMLLNRNPETKIWTVSDCRHSQGNMMHIHAHFNTPRGRRTIRQKLKLVAPDNGDEHGPDVLVLLDYYWLQQHYYQKRYGMDWLQSGAWELLTAGATEVLLPYDCGWGNSSLTPDMSTMLSGSVHEDTTVELKPHACNPLWVASADPGIRTFLEQSDNGDNDFQTRKYLHPSTPFVSITKREVQVDVTAAGSPG